MKRVKRIRRLGSILLSVCLVFQMFTALAVPVAAAQTEYQPDFSKVEWKYQNNGSNAVKEIPEGGVLPSESGRGIVIGYTMGCILLFDIPVALGLLKKDDRPVLACGILAGAITAPIGCFVGGIVMNLTTDYHMNLLTMLCALLPVILVALALAAGLWFKPTALMNGFAKFGAFVTGMIAIFVAIAVLQEKTGIRLPLFRLMVEENAEGVSPLANSITILGDIAFILLGAFPMVEWIKRHFGGKLAKLGSRLGMNEAASAGIVATLDNNIPTFQMVKDMNPKGKLLNIAFASCAAFMFGDHLGFVAGVNETMIVPMIFAKLACGLSALALANLLAPVLLSKAESADKN